MKKIAFACLMLLIVILFLLPHDTEESKRFKTSYFDLFDTYTELIIYAKDEAEATAIAAIVRNELSTCHRLYDIYHDYEGINNMRTVNQNAGIAPVTVDQRIIDLLIFGKEMYHMTDGQVNIAMGNVLSIWHEKRTAGIADPANAVLPEMKALREAAMHMDIDDLIIDEQSMTVYLLDKELLLDVGAIAKGYAAERAAEMMIAHGVESALLSVGGNVRAIGLRGDETIWQVGVQNPDLDAGENNIATVSLLDSSMVTSGGYQRNYMVAGKRYHHIIDPNTLMPSEYYQSVTILAADSGIADAMSTALFTVSIERGNQILRRFDNVHALWVTLEGRIEKTSGFTTE